MTDGSTPPKKRFKHSATGKAAASDTSKQQQDSRQIGLERLEWLLHPIKPAVFFRDYWEKKPLLIRRSDRSYYA